MAFMDRIRLKKPTVDARAAAEAFNAATGWYAATAHGNRVDIKVDPAKCDVLTRSYLAQSPA